MTETSDKPLYWRLEPVHAYRAPPAAEPAVCVATGSVVDNWGGRGLYLSNEAVSSLIGDRHDHVLMPRKHYEDMRELLRESRAFMEWYNKELIFNSDRSGVLITLARIRDLMG